MFVGVFGHKPTPHSVSIVGHVPDCLDKRFADYFILGPMVRYVEDLPVALNVLIKPEFKPLLRLNQEVNKDLKIEYMCSMRNNLLIFQVDIRNIKFYYMEDDSNSHLSSSVDSNIISQMRKFITHLQVEYGIKAQKVCFEINV